MIDFNLAQTSWMTVERRADEITKYWRRILAALSPIPLGPLCENGTKGRERISLDRLLISAMLG